MSVIDLALDTNIVAPILNADRDVLRHLTADIRVYVPTVVLGELYRGARKSTG